MRIEELALNHLMKIRVRPMELSDLGAHWFNNADEYLSSQFKKAVLRQDGEVVFILGGNFLSNESEGGVWILASDLIYENPVASMEMILRLHEVARETFPEVKRYFTLNDPEFPDAINFLIRLGYKIESEVKREDGAKRILLVKEIE